MKLKLIIMSLLISSSVFAASSGTLLLKGTVLVSSDVVVVPLAKATTLNVTTGEVSTSVANVNETSNNRLGYKINLTSANGGKLKLTTDVTKTISYTMDYAGKVLTLSTTAQTAKTVSSLSAKTTSTSLVKITTTGNINALGGDYTDTVTISIVSN
jgi:hypothetical protein